MEQLILRAHWRLRVCASPGTCSYGAGTLRVALRTCPRGGVAMILGEPTSGWEQGRPRDTLCLVPVASCSSHISLPQGQDGSWKPPANVPHLLLQVRWTMSLLPAAQGREGQRGMSCLRYSFHSPTQTLLLTHLPAAWHPLHAASSNPAGCGQQ